MIGKLVQGFANMPTPIKVGVVAVGLAGIMIVVLLFGGTGAIYVVLAGLVVIGLLMAAYQGVLNMLARRRAAPMERSIASNAAMAPQGITEPARRARLDDLRKNFEGGVEKFRAAGKNLYALPWYLLVGEPGSGKTEAIRHCNVGFPPGLQDQLQGAGGTLNMNWWFTNHAVILDTAGRLLFEEVEPGTSSEWQEFLKLLKRNRPNCPVNGMLLVIPAESLIKDTAEQLEAKGSRIAHQLDSIQRVLGVRFPVFVLVTKCDLINGFREFFDEITDPALQHQVMGWSNPEPLDAPFKPEMVEEHLKTVQERLIRRRTGLLLDPVNTEDAKKPRADQVDALYAFPEAMMKIAPRMRRYLEMIFVAGEWSQKPLFLRGIYFTSSMREGSALDQDLAEAFGVPVESLPEGRIWERDRAYFLRDLFMNKVFREKGLVTQAINTQKLQQTRNMAVYGAAAAGLIAVGLFTWLGARGLANSVVGPADFWAQAGKAYLAKGNDVPADPAHGTTEQFLPIVSRETLAVDFKYRGSEKEDDVAQLALIPLPEGHKRTRAAMARELEEQAQTPISVPFIFRPVAAVLRDNAANLAQADREAAARVIFEGSILRPLVDACRIYLKKAVDAGEALSPEATAAAEQLTRLEKACLAGGGKQQLLDLGPLMRYALHGNNDFVEKGAQNDLAMLDETYRSLYTEDSWPPASVKALYAKALPEGVKPGTASTSSTPPIPPPVVKPGPGPTPPVAPPTALPATAASLKFPLGPFTGPEAELTPEELAEIRSSPEKFRTGNAQRDKRLTAMLGALPTASHPAQICTVSVLADEPPSLGKTGLVAGAPFVAVATVGGESGARIALAGGKEARLTRLRAPGAAFELRFYATGDKNSPAPPAATVSVPSRWGGMYLIDHFHGQPSGDGRRVWDVEADVGGSKTVWLRLEFDVDLPELPWYP